MADFDNGLPPKETDVTDKSINGIFVSKTDVAKSEISKISAVMVGKSEIESSDINKIRAILISTEPAGKNTAMFL